MSQLIRVDHTIFNDGSKFSEEVMTAFQEMGVKKHPLWLSLVIHIKSENGVLPYYKITLSGQFSFRKDPIIGLIPLYPLFFLDHDKFQYVSWPNPDKVAVFNEGHHDDKIFYQISLNLNDIHSFSLSYVTKPR